MFAVELAVAAVVLTSPIVPPSESAAPTDIVPENVEFPDMIAPEAYNIPSFVTLNGAVVEEFLPIHILYVASFASILIILSVFDTPNSINPVLLILALF